MADAITRLSGGAGSSAAHVQALQALPPQQQLVIIAAVRMLSASFLPPRLVQARSCLLYPGDGVRCFVDVY